MAPQPASGDLFPEPPIKIRNEDLFTPPTKIVDPPPKAVESAEKIAEDRLFAEPPTKGPRTPEEPPPAESEPVPDYVPTPVPKPVSDYVPTPVPKPCPEPVPAPENETPKVVKSLSLSNLKKLEKTALPPAMTMEDRVVDAIVKNRSAERDIIRETMQERATNDDADGGQLDVDDAYTPPGMDVTDDENQDNGST